ncbi:hypothetical protein BDN72DRAFT_837721 [Pluteus cervinus]|uniref:Uncharacterized protein n=1 Tax=Pluteus cervinus TaxID=181527 RepID=A0ACD3B0N8_9AGAR|nr:hypothetical protein BDN72DRAFT_837721 [Pluteus cervinus]
MTAPSGLSSALRITARYSLSRPGGSTLPVRGIFTKSTAPPPSPLRTGLYATILAVSTGLFAVYYFDSRSALHRYFLTPALRYTLSPENGHKVAVKVLRSGLGPRDPVTDDARLTAELWGEEISNPVGLAAGFDKNGEAIDGLFDLGFSWVEIGSVTPKPQAGNPQPRVFHLPEDAGLINRYGFPSEGQASVLSRLRSRIPSFLLPSTSTTSESPSTHSPQHASLRSGALLAVNLGKNKTSSAESIDDFLSGVKTFGPYADVLVVNVSSPNTPGLRGLQNRQALEDLLSGVIKARNDLPLPRLTHAKPKILVKLAPDLDTIQLEEIAEVIRTSGIDGVIISNTTVQRPSGLINPNKSEQGGFSGPLLKPLSISALRTLRTHLPSSIPIIGCGGISSGQDALEFARAGAAMVQMYTHFGYGGAGACRRVKDEIEVELKKEGKTWKDVVNEATEKLAWKEPKKEKGTVELLIEEALQLNDLLDKLGEKIDLGAGATRGNAPAQEEAHKSASSVGESASVAVTVPQSATA